MDEITMCHDGLESNINYLKTCFKVDSKQFTYIIGITRGGLIPAVMLSHRLGIPMLTYNVTSYKDKKQQELNIIQGGDLLDIITHDDKILVVDDICDTGNTIRYMREMLSGYDITVASIIIKPDSKKDVDYYGAVINNNTWIKFPWEV
jgi:xanthine phosphoribosyltransferase